MAWDTTARLLLSTVVVCLAFEGAAAAAAIIKNPASTIAVRYDDDLWSAGRKGENLNFVCRADACGGTSARCNFAEVLPDGGSTPPTFTQDTLANLEARILADLEIQAPGSRPEIVEAATERAFGVLYDVFASVRAEVGGIPSRYSYLYMDAYDAILVVGCSTPEDRYLAALPAHDALKARAWLPRPAQPE